MKKLVVLGSTGSIGTQTLDVIKHLAGEWEVEGLSCRENIKLLERQAREFRPRYLVVMNDRLAKELEYNLIDMDIKVMAGPDGLEELAGLPGIDLLVNSLVGAVGLRPTITALEAGKTIGLANKESLVIGGEIINGLLERGRGRLLPLDSEHNALFQLLEGKDRESVRGIILTASGGPFKDTPRERLKEVTVEEALNHPNWDMGGKISIDSATMVNKGLEVIEAHWLFRLPYDKIDVLIHPESIVHSLIELVDGSVLAEMAVADMRIPIQYALTYPERRPGQSRRLDLLEVGQLSFVPPDPQRFPGLSLAYRAGREGGTMPAVYNGANEVAVERFLQGKLPFLEISRVIARVMERHENINNPELEDIYRTDRWARGLAKEVVENVSYHN